MEYYFSINFFSNISYICLASPFFLSEINNLLNTWFLKITRIWQFWFISNIKIFSLFWKEGHMKWYIYISVIWNIRYRIYIFPFLFIWSTFKRLYKQNYAINHWCETNSTFCYLFSALSCIFEAEAYMLTVTDVRTHDVQTVKVVHRSSFCVGWKIPRDVDNIN